MVEENGDEVVSQAELITYTHVGYYYSSTLSLDDLSEINAKLSYSNGNFKIFSNLSLKAFLSFCFSIKILGIFTLSKGSSPACRESTIKTWFPVFNEFKASGSWISCKSKPKKGFNSSIVTQWTLNIDQTNSWVKEIKKNIISKNQGKININLGIAGPAKLTTLINYAKICGVSATSLIIRNKKFGLTKLVKHNPSEIISGLEEYDNLHFFPFGGIKELSEWINNSK